MPINILKKKKHTYIYIHTHTHTHTHTHIHTLIAFPPQQWLHECTVNIAWLLNHNDTNLRLQNFRDLVINCGMNKTRNVLYSTGHLAGHEACVALGYTACSSFIPKSHVLVCLFYCHISSAVCL